MSDRNSDEKQMRTMDIYEIWMQLKEMFMSDSIKELTNTSEQDLQEICKKLGMKTHQKTKKQMQESIKPFIKILLETQSNVGNGTIISIKFSDKAACHQESNKQKLNK